MAVNSTPGEVDGATDGYPLPCDRRLEDLWERIEAGEGPADEHERACPHCTAARESLLVLNAATRELADEPVEPPAGLTERIMSAVRADIRRTELVPLPSAGGPIQVSGQAIAVVLRFAVDSVPGVRARRCTVRTRGAGEDGSGVIDVELSLALRYGIGPAEQVLADVRSRIIAAASDGIGLRVATCDLRIEDVLT